MRWPGGRGSSVLRIFGSLNDVPRIQRRMHNKIFVADNAMAIAGGRNLGDTYFGQDDATNFVELGGDSGLTVFKLKILAGKAIVISPSSATLYAKADTAAARILIVAVEA